MKILFVITLLLTSGLLVTSADDEPSPFLDMASEFLQSTLSNQNGGGGGIGGIAQVLGSLMQGDATGGSASGGGAAQIISGIGALIQNMNNQGSDKSGGGGGGGFDPAMLINMVSMFAQMNQGANQGRGKRSSESDTPTMDAILNVATTFLSNMNKEGDDDEDEGVNKARGDQGPKKQNNAAPAWMDLLPTVIQAVQTFTGPAMEEVEKKHKDHAHVLPPFLEHLHVMWDQFQNSELGQAMFARVGLDKVFKGFVGRDGKMDYEKLFDTLENQSFRRRWIRNAIIYLADWANYLSNPEVYQRYIATGQIMANSFLRSQGYPDTAQLDINRPSETIANVIDHTARRQLQVKISSIVYVKPAVMYLKDLLKLGKARETLKKINATEISDKLTDSLNLEVIEPVLKIHRAYRYIKEHHKCDQYVLCELNSHDKTEDLGLAGFKTGVTKFGSMAAAWFISSETGTPFWTLFGAINDPYKCMKKHQVDCQGFHDGEVRVTTEFAHNEL